MPKQKKFKSRDLLVNPAEQAEHVLYASTLDDFTIADTRRILGRLVATAGDTIDLDPRTSSAVIKDAVASYEKLHKIEREQRQDKEKILYRRSKIGFIQSVLEGNSNINEALAYLLQYDTKITVEDLCKFKENFISAQAGKDTADFDVDDKINVDFIEREED